MSDQTTPDAPAEPSFGTSSGDTGDETPSVGTGGEPAPDETGAAEPEDARPEADGPEAESHLAESHEAEVPDVEEHAAGDQEAEGHEAGGQENVEHTEPDPETDSGDTSHAGDVVDAVDAEPAGEPDGAEAPDVSGTGEDTPGESTESEAQVAPDDDHNGADDDADGVPTVVPASPGITEPAPEQPAAAAPAIRVATQLDTSDTTWWRNAIFYQIYPRSFSDANGDGVGDLVGVISRLGYLELLGVDAIWLSPIMRSPMADHGYDVSDPRDIDPVFGSIALFDNLIAEAHARDIRVTMDLVPNHTSDQHAWFQAALAAAPGSPERARYIFRDGRGENGDEPPNNWHSVFGGPAWHRVTEADGSPGQWYMHIFAPEQPDLNWENPEVFEDLEKTLRFWLDRGVDGFRIDVAHGMAKPEDLPDMDLDATRLLENNDDDPRFNNYAVHEIHRKIRTVMDDYPGAANVGEIWVEDNERFAEYLRPDELHLGFNFRLAKAEFTAESVRSAIENSLDAVLSVNGTPTWTLSNHDVDREVSRYTPGADGPDPDGPDPDVALADGILAARAMALVELALPGSIFIYNGAELGLPNADLPDEALQDPVWERSGHTERGRDNCRVPIPWEGTEPPYGFSTATDTWLPMPDSWAPFTVESQLEDVGSTLSLYRQAIELRYSRKEFTGSTVEWYGAPEGCLAFRRSEGHLICALNTTAQPVELPPGELLLSSYPLTDGLLPPRSAAWLAELSGNTAEDTATEV